MNELESDNESHVSIDNIKKYPTYISSNIHSPLFYHILNPTISYSSNDIILEDL